MDIRTILELDAQSLVVEQHKALQTFAINQLKMMITHIDNDDYQKANDMLAYSGAGDGNGSENYYIDFSKCGLDDIGDVLFKLQKLHAMIL